MWLGVAAQVWRRKPGWLERLAGRLLRSPGLARALLTTPSLLLPWLIAGIVVLGAGAAATLSTGQPLVALMAPELAAAAIGAACTEVALMDAGNRLPRHPCRHALKAVPPCPEGSAALP